MSGAEGVTVALIGYGYWGPNLLRNYMELRDFEMKWVCDLNPKSLETARRRYPSVQATTSVRDVLDDSDVDAVLVATPITTHCDLATAALQAGKHVFVEKPLSASAEQCVQLMALAAKQDLTLMVGQTFIYSPPVRKVKELIDAGELGEVRFVTTQRVNLGLHQKDVSVVWDLAAHDVSILDYWLGETPCSVGSSGRDCMRTGIPDVAFISLQYPSGLVALVNVSWLSPVKLRGTVVVGSEKMLVYDDTAPVEKVKIFDHGADFREPTTFSEFQMTYHTGDILTPKIDTIEPLRLEAEHFLHCVRTGRRPITDGEMGLRVVAVLEAADGSLRDGVRKSVAFPERRHETDRRRLRLVASWEAVGAADCGPADCDPVGDADVSADRRSGFDRRIASPLVQSPPDVNEAGADAGA